MEQEIQEIYNEVMKLENLLAEYNEFLERLESMTEDSNAVMMIRNFLIKQKVWS